MRPASLKTMGDTSERVSREGHPPMSLGGRGSKDHDRLSGNLLHRCPHGCPGQDRRGRARPQQWRGTPCLAPFTHREGRTRQLDTRGRPSSDSWRTAHCARRRQLCTSSLSSADVPHLQVRCSRRRAARPPDQVALLDAAHASYDADQSSAGMYSPASSLASVKRWQLFAGKHGDPKRRVPAEVLLDRHG